MEFKDELEELNDMIEVEWKKWIDSSRNCKTYEHISRINVLLHTYLNTPKNNMEFILLSYKMKLSCEDIAKCFKKRRNVEEEGLKLKREKAVMLLGEIYRKCANYLKE